MGKNFQELVLEASDYRAVITCRGAGLRELSYRGRPLIQSYNPGEPAPLGAHQLLAPWPNRTADGRFICAGRTFELERSEAARHNAIHGFIRRQEFEVISLSPHSATLRLRDQPHPGWPWAVTYTVVWSLGAETGLSLDFQAHNTSDTAMPFGFGFHPYICAQGAPVDRSLLALHSVSSYLPLETSRNLPAGPVSPLHTLENEGTVTTHQLEMLGEGMPLEGVFFDHCFGPGVNEATLIDPRSGRGVRITGDESISWMQVFTPDPARGCGFPGVGRAVAVEPMTCPPDALRSGTDLMTIAPNEVKKVSVSIGAYQRTTT
ncbi:MULTISPECIES: aldose 1-epimerase family protein [unclassified Corynebacterium]|uniref:aldose 1-epimerase family protein n=1 Tax=unclassified Corynebacterium TaxID=2624378 RepID=UPI0021676C5E|nr:MULTISPECIES: aldose 1-epimerase family protein [unclassified Corynebacterium]MCS4489134.1 aldose 1-epimerase family protein [Corynebacterium sp. ES2775-CONJ]MCS4490947.1 aldose 1-epimerase family protein [Corynebacterium sp. ES2715-CONJ3]MCS4531171.1 aldose 1-epimerase family protein [Corynebacterium sp. ES2730-CONJ]